ncbi:VOC family protein, partial [Nocardia cyriacigeorgica]|uniref:VOC family protein n=1 Tax=Nocardia cyriacigeorgica TaxID=135487 RepID=UPI002B4B33C2
MALSSFYPVLATSEIAASRDFYTRWFGFEITFEADWYVSLHRPGRDGEPAYDLAL